jgi:TFIIF-interacting CTD phosphatase-like protein
MQPKNSIHIQSWFDNPHDVELMGLMGLLDELAAANSVMELLAKHRDNTLEASLSLNGG